MPEATFHKVVRPELASMMLPLSVCQDVGSLVAYSLFRPAPAESPLHESLPDRSVVELGRAADLRKVRKGGAWRPGPS